LTIKASQGTFPLAQRIHGGRHDHETR
jgi:hypothetical protein